MPAYFKSFLKDFILLSATTVVGELTIANSQASTRFQLAPEAIDAWRLQLNPLQTGISEFLSAYPASQDSSIFLEYPIPIIGKRIDAVILMGHIVVVVETKTGEAASPAVRQVEDYALNLACFHEACNHRTIVPLVISAASTSGAAGGTSFDDLIEDTVVTAPNDFGRSLCEIAKVHLRPNELQMATDTFDHGRFKPIPRIIDAAVGLYHDMNVFEIGHACAAEDSLNKTTNALVRAVLTARERNKKIICFVTGVPGAGKTLVGLNAVHEPEIRNVGSFLSGNGPLVKIIQEALVRDIVERSRRTDRPVTRADASLRVRAFIYNVHRFVDEHRDVCPTRKVVFDEAQRAWDKAENEKAGRVGSEPEMMLDIMGRHEDWAVIIALVGGGQEINRGEAGLAEWGRSLQAYADWEIFASPQVLNGGDSVGVFSYLTGTLSIPPDSMRNPNFTSR